MPFVAHVAVQLNKNYSDFKEEWHFIKRSGDIEYRWRLRKDMTYEVISGLYIDSQEALKYAKRMYVTLLLTLLNENIPICESGCEFYAMRIYDKDLDGDYDDFISNEKYFFWNKRIKGGRLGPGVFEVDNSLEEFSNYDSLLYGSIEECLLDENFDLSNIDEYYFQYSRETQKYLNTLVLADSEEEYGMRMVLYCGLLEHLAEDQTKEPEVVEIIDELILCVNSSELSNDQKDQLKNFLNTGKTVSARQKCRLLADKYAQKAYNGISTRTIVNEAYNIRSSYSHNAKDNNNYDSPAYYMKYVVLDVIKGYMQEKERLSIS